MLSEETHAAFVADKAGVHEAAAHEKRNWVRLTFECNNRCTFCLDSNTHDGEMRARDEVKQQILDGRAQGATRLILSGGEPTIHPQFVDFIRLGRLAGYSKIQTVTNGRLFAYPGFLGRCLDAGLSEITFSLHGPNAKIHDALVGVAGAFAQETEGLRRALADGRAVVNVDVVINKGNVDHLPQMLELFTSWGVREFDLLQVVPFGRAFTEGRESLFYDLEEKRPVLLEAFAYSKRPGLHLWLNRFPPQHLEGYEPLIQDPYKLNDEVRGRKEEFQGLLEDGVDLDCRDPARCRYCYLERLCDHLYATQDELRADRFERVRVDTGWELRQTPVFGGDPASARRRASAERAARPVPPRYPSLQACVKAVKAKRVWVVAKDVGSALAELAKYEGELEVELELGEYLGLPEALREGSLQGKRLACARATSTDQAKRLLELDGDFEVLVALSRETAPWLLELAHVPARLALYQPTHERLTESAEGDVDLPAFFQRFRHPVPVENVPACITGRLPREPPRTLDASMLGPDGGLEIFRYTQRYLLEHYFTKSLRCSGCVHAERCAGLHINYVRAHGYGAMAPVKAG